MDNNISKIGASANFFVQNKAVKKDEKDPKTEQKGAEQAGSKPQQKSPDAIFDAMNLSALQNKAFITNKTQVNTIDPKNYLSADRIQDIEASMAAFEAATLDTLDAFNAEFDGIGAWDNMSEADKLALAAQIQE